MARLVGIILMVLGIYVGVTVATEGVDRAFGGLFVIGSRGEPEAAGSSPAPGSPAEAEVAEPPRPVTARVRERVQGAVDDRTQRIDSY